MVTGIDLIKSQIAVAAGQPLPFKQEDIVLRGCAIECRINAEKWEHNFRPDPGRIDSIFYPGGMGVRFDSHVYAGYTVPPYYDSMIGKLLVHRPTRSESIACMLRALDELQVKGIETTAPFHRRLMSHKPSSSMGMSTPASSNAWGRRERPEAPLGKTWVILAEKCNAQQDYPAERDRRKLGAATPRIPEGRALSRCLRPAAHRPHPLLAGRPAIGRRVGGHGHGGSIRQQRPAPSCV
jgi:acetyl/propionyl-CoA carboxylase alpha subunit